MKAIIGLKKIRSALLQSQSPLSLDTKSNALIDSSQTQSAVLQSHKPQIGNILKQPAINELPMETTTSSDTMDEKAVIKYVEERTINEFDDEISKLKKISLCWLDIGPQAKQFSKYFGNVDRNMVPQTKLIYSCKPEHNLTWADFIMNSLALEHTNEEEQNKIVNKWQHLACCEESSNQGRG